MRAKGLKMADRTVKDWRVRRIEDGGPKTLLKGPKRMKEVTMAKGDERLWEN